jgi:hypothetical protein
MFTIQAKITSVLDVRTGVSKNTGNQWTSRDYLAEYKEGDRDVAFQFTVFGDRIAPLIVGKTYALTLMIECREWQGKYYNSVKATAAYIQADAPVVEQADAPQEQQRKHERIPQKPAAVIDKDGHMHVKDNEADGIPF